MSGIEERYGTGSKPRVSQRALSFERSPLYSIKELSKALPDVIRLNIGAADFKNPERLIQAAKDALDAGYTHYAHDRGDPRAKAGREIRE